MSPTPTTDRDPDRPQWTPRRIRELGPVTDIPTAGAILGLSRATAYDLAATGRFPVPVIRTGSRYRVPVPALLTLLHLPLEPTVGPTTTVTHE